MEHKKRKARPHDSGKEMITVGIQTNVEIVCPHRQGAKTVKRSMNGCSSGSPDAGTTGK